MVEAPTVYDLIADAGQDAPGGVDWGDEAGDVMLYMLSPGVGDGVVNLRQ
jgi:hypothetical protein